MSTSLKIAAVVGAALVLGLAAQAQAGGIVFWGGGTRIITTSHRVVPAVQPVVVTAPAPAPVVDRVYRAGYQDGYREGYSDGARATTAYVTTRTVPSIGFPVGAYGPSVIRYRVPTYTRTYRYMRAPLHVYRPTVRIGRMSHFGRMGGLRGIFGW